MVLGTRGGIGGEVVGVSEGIRAGQGASTTGGSCSVKLLLVVVSAVPDPADLVDCGCLKLSS